MPANIRLYGTTGYVELAAPATANNTVLTLPNDSVQPGMVLVNSTTFSSTTAISLNNVFSSTYENYRIVLSSTSTSGQGYFGYFRASGANKTSSLYNFASFYYNQGPSSGNQGVGASLGYATMGITGGSASSSIEIYSPFVSSVPTQYYTNYRYSSTSTSAETTGGFFHGYYASSESHDGIYLYVTSGTWSGTIRVYGYRNS